MRLPFYNFRRGMSNIIRWIPVIWGDEDFDYEPLYNLLYHKLKFMEEFYRSDYTWSAGALKTANEIKIAKNLAKRLTESNYLQNAFIEHKKIYPHYLEKGMHTEKIEEKPLYRIVNLNSQEEKKDYGKWSKHSDYMEKQDREYFFNYLVKKIQGWWD